MAPSCPPRPSSRLLLLDPVPRSTRPRCQSPDLAPCSTGLPALFLCQPALAHRFPLPTRPSDLSIDGRPHSKSRRPAQAPAAPLPSTPFSRAVEIVRLAQAFSFPPRPRNPLLLFPPTWCSSRPLSALAPVPAQQVLSQRCRKPVHLSCMYYDIKVFGYAITRTS